MMHILVSQNEYMEVLQQSATDHNPVDWTCPKAATPGDQVYFFITSGGVVAHGTVVSDTAPSEEWPNRYEAQIGKVRFFSQFIPLTTIQTQMPDFGWARYPRSYVTPTLSEAKAFSSLIEMASGTASAPLVHSAPVWLNVDKPLKSLVIHTRNGCSDERRKGVGIYKPVGMMGRDGGWLPFGDSFTAIAFGKKNWPSYKSARHCTNCTRKAPLADLDDENETGSEEGGRKFILHRRIERDRNLVLRKRQA
ncbi:MAG: hypothetical protein ACAI34_11750, partial [Verrucomicrobium sp.]